MNRSTARPPCPSPTPRAYSNSCPLSRWCYLPTISSSVVPFSSCPQSFPASGSFQMSQLFASDGQSIGASASASVLPVNIQDWFPLGWTSRGHLISAPLKTECGTNQTGTWSSPGTSQRTKDRRLKAWTGRLSCTSDILQSREIRLSSLGISVSPFPKSLRIDNLCVCMYIYVCGLTVLYCPDVLGSITTYYLAKCHWAFFPPLT